MNEAADSAQSAHPPTDEPIARREVVHGDALAWLRARPRSPNVSVIASIPDVSELGITLEKWREFFLEAARVSLDATPDDGLTFFFQTDIKREGRWVSKAGLVLRAADELDVPLLWHKIVCRRDPGQMMRGRPTYSHFFAFSRGLRDHPNQSTPDVLPDLGVMPWTHSMGTRAAELAMHAIRTMSPATTRLFIPFCGVGTALAVANQRGYDAVGIERNRKRADVARTFTLDAVVP